MDMFTGDFSPPEKPLSSPFHPVMVHFTASDQSCAPRSPSEMASPPMGSACDSNHEALLNLVDSIYTSLSADWNDKFEADLARDVIVQQIFRGHVDRICCDFITGSEQSKLDADGTKEILYRPEPAPSPTTPIAPKLSPSEGPNVNGNAGASTPPEPEMIHYTSDSPTLYQQSLTPHPQQSLEFLPATPQTRPTSEVLSQPEPHTFLEPVNPDVQGVEDWEMEEALRPGDPSGAGTFIRGPGDANQELVDKTGRRQSTRRRKQAEMGPTLIAGGRRSPEGRK